MHTRAAESQTRESKSENGVGPQTKGSEYQKCDDEKSVVISH